MPKFELTPQQRRALRAAAHPLHPVVQIGDRGLIAPVMDEIDRSLSAHELIKIHVAGADRDGREAMLATICDTLSCAAVHHLGKTLIIYRAKDTAQQPAPGAERALRRKSDPYIPKKRAAHGHDAKRPRAAVAHGLNIGGRAGSEPPARRETAARQPAGPTRRGLDAGRPGTHAARASRPHGITRRGGSALTLRAGRRGRTTRS